MTDIDSKILAVAKDEKTTTVGGAGRAAAGVNQSGQSRAWGQSGDVD